MAAGQDETVEDGEAASGAKRAGKDGPTLDKRTLLSRVVASSGLPAPQARKLMDAVLAEIGAGLDAGATMSLAPLGKLRPVRSTGSGDNTVHTLRLRRASAKGAGSGEPEDALPGAKARARVKAGAAARRPGAKAEAQPGDKAARRGKAGGSASGRVEDEDGDD